MVLNNRKAEKSPDSPSRFFFTNFPCRFTIVDKPPKWTTKKVREIFFERVNDELKNTSTPKLGKFDLVFFPIIHQNYFYVMVFNLKEKKVLLMDNSNSKDKEHMSLKYGEVPDTLSQMFCDFLESHKMGMKARSMRRVPIDRMKVSWRNSWNKVDCAVYAMRHMETYMRQKVKEITH